MMIIKTIMLIIKTLNMMMIIIFRPGSPVCECNKGWGGDQCIQPLCNPPCRCPHNDDDDDDDDPAYICNPPCRYPDDDDFDIENHQEIVLQ